jgi:hypothetical protein
MFIPATASGNTIRWLARPGLGWVTGGTSARVREETNMRLGVRLPAAALTAAATALAFAPAYAAGATARLSGSSNPPVCVALDYPLCVQMTHDQPKGGGHTEPNGKHQDPTEP